MRMAPREAAYWRYNNVQPSGNCTLTLSISQFFHKLQLIPKYYPTVYAGTYSESPSDNSDNGESTGMTSVDKLVSARPKIVITDDEVRKFLENESGIDRVRAMFSKDKNGDISGDLSNVIHIAQTCGFFFFLLTSVAGGYQARETFLERNKSTVYATKFRAARAFNDAVLFGSMRFGLKWGLKSALFAGIFTLTSQLISVYRNKTSMIDYAVGGGVTCSLLRANMGLRGMFAGGVIGSAIGLIGGVAMYSVLYVTNETQEHRHLLYIREILQEKREVELLSSKGITQSLLATGDVSDGQPIVSEQ